MTEKTGTLDELIATAELGEEAKRFLESDLGKVMVGLAQQEADLAREALETVDPTDTKKITKLQNEVKVSRWFSQWLAELLHDGEAALSTYKQQQQG